MSAPPWASLSPHEPTRSRRVACTRVAIVEATRITVCELAGLGGTLDGLFDSARLHGNADMFHSYSGDRRLDADDFESLLPFVEAAVTR